MVHWLGISSDYNNVHIFLCSSATIICAHSLDKKDGNKLLLVEIDNLLKQKDLKLQDLSFIGVNVGPAPYTGLRIAIATANGLHAATGLPLVAIDALKAFVQAHMPKDKHHATVALLNAFNNDLFYAVARYDTQMQAGYEKAPVLLERLALELKGLSVEQIGNAAPGSTKEYPLPDQLARYAYQCWQERKITNLALPLYLKQI